MRRLTNLTTVHVTVVLMIFPFPLKQLGSQVPALHILIGTDVYF
jgi:hypothetical protein